MLLAVDVGNTQTLFGLFEGETLRADWRIATHKHATSDEVGVMLRALFEQGGIDAGQVRGVIVSSVVPDLNGVMAEMTRRGVDSAN